MKAVGCDPAFGTTEVCAAGFVVMLASIAGGLGGGSPAQRGVWGQSPPTSSARQLPCAGGGKGRPRPCTPGQGLGPLDPSFDAFLCPAFGVHAYGAPIAGICQLMSRHDEG